MQETQTMYIWSWVRKIPGIRNGNTLLFGSWKIYRREAWRVTVNGVAESDRTKWRNTDTPHTHTCVCLCIFLEREGKIHFRWNQMWDWLKIRNWLVLMEISEDKNSFLISQFAVTLTNPWKVHWILSWESFSHPP